MRIALIADIHANLVSFEAVLADIDRANVEQVVCLGDVAATGPQPRETLARLKKLGCPVVQGNADAWLLDPQPPVDAEGEARTIAEISAWCAAQLEPEDLTYIRTFRPTLELPLPDGGSLLCFHGSVGSYDDIIVATTPEEELDRLLAGAHATIMAGGHTHVPMLRRHKDTLLLNPGSVGMPFEVVARSGRVRNPPWAEYGVIDTSAGSVSVEFRRVTVDVHAIAEAIFGSGMPHADVLAQDWG